MNETTGSARDFRLYWAGLTINALGSQVSLLALPLIAVVLLDADATQMGILTAAGYVPFILVGLQAGVWVDRMRRRPLLIWSNLLVAGLLMTIPLAAVLGVLRLEQLYLLALVIGGIHVVSDVAEQSFLPRLVDRAQLPAANARLTGSESVAQIVGPSAAGVLIQVLTAPIAIIVDAASFVVSAVLLSGMRTAEPPPLPDEQRRDTRGLIVEGLRHVTSHRLLRPIFTCGATHNFSRRAMEALFVLYAVDQLGLDPIALGIVLAAGGPGSLLGAVVAVPFARRFGVGPTIAWTQVLTGVACLVAPLAAGPPWLTIGLLALGQALLGVARPIFNIAQLSLRQAITPERLQGRVNATMRFIMWGVTPLGALAGGLLGTAIGLRPTLFVAAIGVLLATVWIVRSPVLALRDVPDLPSEGGVAA